LVASLTGRLSISQTRPGRLAFDRDRVQPARGARSAGESLLQVSSEVMILPLLRLLGPSGAARFTVSPNTVVASLDDGAQ